MIYYYTGSSAFAPYLQLQLHVQGGLIYYLVGVTTFA